MAAENGSELTPYFKYADIVYIFIWLAAYRFEDSNVLQDNCFHRTMKMTILPFARSDFQAHLNRRR